MNPSRVSIQNVELVRGMVLDLKKPARPSFSTHIMEQAEQICDSVSIIHKGRVVVDGALADVGRQPPRYQLDTTAIPVC